MNSIFILKPDGVKNKDNIKEIITANFKLYLFNNFNATPNFIYDLYHKYVDENILKGLNEYLTESSLIAGTTSATINELIILSGKQTNPEDCNFGTIRNMYGEGLSLTKSSIYIVKNAIHRPKNAEQNKEIYKILNKYKIL